MSRLTAADAYGLMEAYNAVYAPQELAEEQVWEEVENWVNSLLEEGYDLSDYTWEEMYEGYLEEILGMPGAQNAGAALRQSFGQARRAVGGAISDVAGSAARGLVGQTTTSRNPISQAYNAVTRGVTAPTRALTSFAGGVLSGKPATTTKPPTKPPSRTFQSDSGGSTGFGRYAEPTQFITPTPARTPAPTPRTPSRVTPGVTPVPITRTPAPTRTPARTATPPGGTTKPTAPATTTPTPAPAPSAPRPKDTSITDMIGRSQVRQGAAVNTGNTSSDTRAIAGRSSVGATPKPATSTATARPTPRQARLNMEMEYDTFDTVLEYLVAEGYADTEESALVIMANMSEEWKQSIVEGMFDFLPKSTTVIPGKYGKNTVLSKKGGVEGVSDKSKPGSFTPQKGGFDKMDAERYATQHSKQGTSSGTSGINLAGRREISGRVK